MAARARRSLPEKICDCTAFLLNFGVRPYFAMELLTGQTDPQSHNVDVEERKTMDDDGKQLWHFAEILSNILIHILFHNISSSNAACSEE